MEWGLGLRGDSTSLRARSAAHLSNSLGLQLHGIDVVTGTSVWHVAPSINTPAVAALLQSAGGGAVVRVAAKLLVTRPHRRGSHYPQVSIRLMTRFYLLTWLLLP